MILDTNSRIFPSTRGLGTSNTAFGKFALNEDEAGSNYNTAFGESAIGSATLNDATYNTAVGFTALESLTTGDYNVAVGADAGDALTTGVKNVATIHIMVVSKDPMTIFSQPK